MTTLSELRDNVRSYGNFAANDTRITDFVIDREINRALRRIAMIHDWPWLDKQRVIILTGDYNEYALPSDFLRLVSVRYESDNEELWPRSIQELDQLASASHTGRASVYAIYDGKLVLAPVPAGEETIRLRYVRQEIVLVADNDAPLIPDYWLDGVYDAALAELHRMVKEVDLSGIAEARFLRWVAETQDNIPQTRSLPRVRVRPGSFT